MAYPYFIQEQFSQRWQHGWTVAERLLGITSRSSPRAYLPVHGDSMLGQLGDDELLSYFIYTLSSWWEYPLIDRINAGRPDNNFAILMDINPVPETMYRLQHLRRAPPETRYKAGLQEMFPNLDLAVADAMYRLLRNGFGHNLFGREPGKVMFDNDFDCPPTLDENSVLLISPIELALSMVHHFLAKILELVTFPLGENWRIFRTYMTGTA